jgi:hypothetical protein
MMAAKADLKEIVDALEMQFDELPAYLDRDTGEVHQIPLELIREAEEEDEEERDDLPDWEKPLWQVARLIVKGPRFVRLPSKFDVHEWEIMNDFSLSVESASIRKELLDAIRGSGAFRLFKNTIRRRRIEPAWYEFRSRALREIAIEWCAENDIPWH